MYILYMYIYAYFICNIKKKILQDFNILTKAFKYIIPFFSCDVWQSSFEI